MKTENKISWKKQVAFLGVFLTGIAALFLLVELLLGFLSIGVSTEPFEKIAGKPGFLHDNSDEFINKYMTYTSPTGLMKIPNLFREEKKPGVLRGIVIGESTPQGVPYEVNQAFPKLTEIFLNQTDSEVEILNISASAMTSFYLKDVAKKITKYDPDFVIIYAGHNEYYGTISVSTGSNPLLQNVYLQLKESRIFQSLFNLTARKPERDDGSLMTRQFAGKTFPLNPNVDENVQSIFINNVKEAITTLTSKGIKVFVMKPVSNLISFPPFKSQGEEIVKEDILYFAEVLKTEKLSDEDTLKLENLRKTYPENAHIIWLLAQNHLRNGEFQEAEALFNSSKDYDMVPFRARSNLIAALESWVASESGADKLVQWVETDKILSSNQGLLAFSWLNFIDQLHFNRNGHYKIAAGLASLIADSFKINTENQVEFNLPVYTPWDEFMAALRMARMGQSSPFKDMILPMGFQIEDHVEGANPFLQSARLRELIFNADDYDNPLYYLNSIFLENRDFSSWEYYLAAEVWKNPGSPGPYLERGNFLAGFPDRRDGALKDWKMAVQLSDSPEVLKTEIRAKMDASGMSAWWDRFEKSLKGAD